jgi:hypothetical protein
MRGRTYHVAQRRFLSRDPLIGSPFKTGSANPYAYVHNNPLNFTDPSGFQDQSWVYTPQEGLVVTADVGGRRGETPQEAGMRAQEQAQVDAGGMSQAMTGQAQAAAMSGSQPTGMSGSGPGGGDGGGRATGGFANFANFVEDTAGDVEGAAGALALGAVHETMQLVRGTEKAAQGLGWAPTQHLGTSVVQALEKGWDTPAGRLFSQAEKLGSAAGAVGAAFDVVDLVQAVNRGDDVEAAISGFKLSSELVGRLGGPVGASFDAGLAIGELIAPVLDHGFMSDLYLSVGKGIVKGLGISVDSGAAR